MKKNMGTADKVIRILIAIIVISTTFIKYRQYQDKKLIAKQAEELAKQTEEIFTAMEYKKNDENYISYKFYKPFKKDDGIANKINETLKNLIIKSVE